jgi:hypothetical protein
VRDAEGVFLGHFLVEHAFFEFESVFLFKEVVVFGPRLVQPLHLALDALLRLRLLLVQLPLQQLRTVLHQLVSAQQIGLARVRHLDYPQTSLNLPPVVCSHPELLQHYFAGSALFLGLASRGRARHLHAFLAALLLPFLEVGNGVWSGKMSGGSFWFSGFAEVLVSACGWAYISERSMMCPSSLSFLRRASSWGLRFSLRKTLMLLAMSSAWRWSYFP